MVTTKSSPEVRQVSIGNFIFKLTGVIFVAPLASYWPNLVSPHFHSSGTSIVMFHLFFNVAITIFFLCFTVPFANLIKHLVPQHKNPTGTERPKHLDQSALASPGLAISCAARETLHQADLVETMLQGLEKVIIENDLNLSKDLRKMDDRVDDLYRAIKQYLTKVSRQELNINESRRWAQIIAFTINLEQIADITERMLQDIEDKKIKKNRVFSDVSIKEICDLHSRLLGNLGLAISVFLNGSESDAKKLIEEKAAYRDLAILYSSCHIDRLSSNAPENIETSSLHLDLISALRRINSHLCSIAYPILDSKVNQPSAGLMKDSTAI